MSRVFVVSGVVASLSRYVFVVCVRVRVRTCVCVCTCARVRVVGFVHVRAFVVKSHLEAVTRYIWRARLAIKNMTRLFRKLFVRVGVPECIVPR